MVWTICGRTYVRQHSCHFNDLRWTKTLLLFFFVNRLKVGWLQTKAGSLNNVQKIRQLANQSSKNDINHQKQEEHALGVVDETGFIMRLMKVNLFLWGGTTHR